MGLKSCKKCGADWKHTTIICSAHFGGGYRIRCNNCQKEWDDPTASYEERRIGFENALRQEN